MPAREKIFLLAVALAILLHFCFGLRNKSYLGSRSGLTAIHLSQLKESLQIVKKRNKPLNQKIHECSVIQSIKLIRTNNRGNDDLQGANYVLIFDPKSKDLDFKVNLGLAHKLYAKDDNGKFRRKYIPKLFGELVYDDNSSLDGKRPIAAINGDYISLDNKPQGLNISRGVDYSGTFKDKRSSFGISGGNPEERIATIKIGQRPKELINYNVVGGNGRFYKNGKFKDICTDLGDYCGQATSRSMAAITDKGYVIFLVNNAALNQALYPSMFKKILEGIANNNCLGKIKEGMLFSGGFYTGFYFGNKILVANPHPIGSVFLIYKK